MYNTLKSLDFLKLCKKSLPQPTEGSMSVGQMQFSPHLTVFTGLSASVV